MFKITLRRECYLEPIYKVSFYAIIAGATRRESFFNNPLHPFVKGEFEKNLKKCEFMDRHYL